MRVSEVVGGNRLDLQKGAAGQALQNMSVVFGLEETAGLL
ncbi:MAG: hypothetical protein BMS9Abin28_0790 [Anaerolineae bacterium]|nr:MAG: hypothetical protein BMS9Abin28_0790 [Anaerolineae bacterium]